MTKRRKSSPSATTDLRASLLSSGLYEADGDGVEYVGDGRFLIGIPDTALTGDEIAALQAKRNRAPTESQEDDQPADPAEAAEGDA